MEGQPDPIRTMVEFVPHLIQGFVEQEGPEEGVPGGSVREEGRIFRRVGVGVEKRRFRPVQQAVDPGFVVGVRVGVVLPGGEDGVLDRSDHAGHVAEGVFALAAFFEGAGRLAFEVEDVHVSFGPKKLPEVIVAVDTDALVAAGHVGERGQSVLGGGPVGVRGQEIGRQVVLAVEERAGALRLVAQALCQFGAGLFGGLDGMEVLRLGAGERVVHLGGPDAERSREGNQFRRHFFEPHRHGRVGEAAVQPVTVTTRGVRCSGLFVGERGVLDPVEEGGGTGEGIAPRVGVHRQGFLKYAEGVLTAASPKLEGAVEARRELEVDTREMLQQFFFGVGPLLQAAIELEEVVFVDDGGGIALLAGEQAHLFGGVRAHPVG